MSNEEIFNGAINNLIDFFIQDSNSRSTSLPFPPDLEKKVILFIRRAINAANNMKTAVPREYLKPEHKSTISYYKQIIPQHPTGEKLISIIDSTKIISLTMEDSLKIIQNRPESIYSKEDKEKMFKKAVELIIFGRKITGPFTHSLELRTEFETYWRELTRNPHFEQFKDYPLNYK